eukprot:SAG11_NODE_1231_length_5456_cov_3.733246_2_plen_295_part_00
MIVRTQRQENPLGNDAFGEPARETRAVGVAMPESSAFARHIAARPLRAMGATGFAMLLFTAVGQLAVPLQFDASVDGFTPRGTPMATRINTGLLIQKGIDEKTLRGFPLADCAHPPIELWLVLCGGGRTGASRASTSASAGGGGAPSFAKLGDMVASLAGAGCGPICAQAVAPWSRECAERDGSTEAEQSRVVAAAILEKLSVTASSLTSVAFTAAQIAAGCTSSSELDALSLPLLSEAALSEAALSATAECVGELVANCSARFGAKLARSAGDVTNSSDISGGEGGGDVVRPL